MTEDEALKLMIRPGARKPNKWRNGVIQIWTTRSCDKACFGCTQASNLRGNPPPITPELFEQAVIALKGYHGVVGVFGGNPSLHPQFELLCEILARHIPWEQRGIWSNSPLGKGAIMRKTFNPKYSNLNVHLDRTAFEEFRRDWPECQPVGLDQDSRHSPPFAGLRDDVDLGDPQRWQLISECDINRHWSGMFGPFRGELRFWFCELAGAQAMMHQHEAAYPDTGFAVTPTNYVWDLSMQEYASQVRKHCFDCGIPKRGFGELSQAANGTEYVSAAHVDVFRPKSADRLVRLVTRSEQVRPQELQTVCDYLGNGRK